MSGRRESCEKSLRSKQQLGREHTCGRSVIGGIGLDMFQNTKDHRAAGGRSVLKYISCSIGGTGHNIKSDLDRLPNLANAPFWRLGLWFVLWWMPVTLWTIPACVTRVRGPRARGF